jgi:hypothetical protein
MPVHRIALRLARQTRQFARRIAAPYNQSPTAFA